MIRLLVEDGKVNMNLQDEESNTCLHWAVKYADSQIIQYLIQSGADINI